MKKKLLPDKVTIINYTESTVLAYPSNKKASSLVSYPASLKMTILVYQFLQCGYRKYFEPFLETHTVGVELVEVNLMACCSRSHTLQSQSRGFTSRSTARVILGQVLSIATCGIQTES